MSQSGLRLARSCGCCRCSRLCSRMFDVNGCGANTLVLKTLLADGLACLLIEDLVLGEFARTEA